MLFLMAEEFLSSKVQFGKLWWVLVGHLSRGHTWFPKVVLDEVLSVGPLTRLGLSGRLNFGSLGLPFSRGSSVVVRRGSS